MPRTTYDETHERILSCGRDAFLHEGFERASLRAICAQAGVTTGAFYKHFADKQALFVALVQPTIDTFLAVYEQACRQSNASLAQGDTTATQEENLRVDRAFVALMYDHRTAFELLFRHAGGTPYEHFTDEMAEREIRFSHQQYDELEARGSSVRRLTDDQMRVLVRAHLDCLAAPILRGCTREEALSHAETVATFFWAGWRETIGATG